MTLPASSHINQTSSKKRYFKHCKGAEFKTSYCIIGFGFFFFVNLVSIKTDQISNHRKQVQTGAKRDHFKENTSDW